MNDLFILKLLFYFSDFNSIRIIHEHRKHILSRIGMQVTSAYERCKLHQDYVHMDYMEYNIDVQMYLKNITTNQNLNSKKKKLIIVNEI